jgi:hypothetical protein
MSDDSVSGDAPDGVRMALEPDALHEGEEEPYLDCPECGSPATITGIIEEGRCTGYLDSEVTEVEDGEQLQDPACTAKLSLELVWGA